MPRIATLSGFVGTSTVRSAWSVIVTVSGTLTSSFAEEAEDAVEPVEEHAASVTVRAAARMDLRNFICLPFYLKHGNKKSPHDQPEILITNNVFLDEPLSDQNSLFGWNFMALL